MKVAILLCMFITFIIGGLCIAVTREATEEVRDRDQRIEQLQGQVVSLEGYIRTVRQGYAQCRGERCEVCK